MVHTHLRRRAQIVPPIAPDEHLDDDLLSAFTEGRLNENESIPVLRHLVACSFCRHITAQLVRLDSEVGETTDSLPPAQEDPGRIRRLLDDLGSRVFVPSDDEAVFAYHAPAEDLKSKDGTSETDDIDDIEEK
jgi:hypothetical protein